MSLEHSPARQARGARKRQAISRICVSPDEFAEATGISKPTLYRMMADGRLRFTQATSRMRKIPTSEYARLGLSGDAA